MRFLTDENLPRIAVELLRELGHDVLDIREASMGGASDLQVAEVAMEEQRILVTQDLDFANILQYPPDEYAGIVVLRVPRPTQHRVTETLRGFLSVVDAKMIHSALVIVEPGSYRVRRSLEVS